VLFVERDRLRFGRRVFPRDKARWKQSRDRILSVSRVSGLAVSVTFGSSTVSPMLAILRTVMGCLRICRGLLKTSDQCFVHLN
jgi:hypothetical protein